MNRRELLRRMLMRQERREQPSPSPAALLNDADEQAREAARALAKRHSESMEVASSVGSTSFDVVAWLERSTQAQTSAPQGPVSLLRPPGALDDAHFRETCTRCGECIRACPYEALSVLPSFKDPSQVGLPTLNPAIQPCLMCDPAPCVARCPTEALSATRPKRIGVAQIRRTSCLAWNNSFCSVCRERCPVPEAIVVQQGRPTIDPASCTGCGLCQHHCPAPLNAVLITPLKFKG